MEVSTAPARIPRGTLSREATVFIREKILAREYPEGMVIRPEDVGKAMGISPTPAREALQALRVEGFLDAVAGKGFVVSSLSPADIEDIFTAHALIAGELAARAARTATPADIDELEAMHFELLAAARRQQLDLVEERNHAFHRHISQLAGSPKLTRILGIVSHYVPRSFYPSIAGWPQASAEDHSQILASLRAGDPESARAAMQSHVEHAGSLLAKRFSE